MKNQKTILLLAELIFLAAFNAIFFIFGGTEHLISVWIAYAMISFSYLMLILPPLFVREKRTALETGAPTAMLSVLNFAVNLIVGLIFIFIAPKSYTFEIILYVILLSIYLAALLLLALANSHTKGSSSKQAKQSLFVKEASAKLKMLIGEIRDSELNRLIESNADDLHASPTRTNDAAAVTEAHIAAKVSEIQAAVAEKRTDDAKLACRELSGLIKERNLKISIDPNAKSSKNLEVVLDNEIVNNISDEGEPEVIDLDK